MEGHVVTTNPWLVMAINMTVVFGVLICLGFIMHLIYLIDPTRKKKTIAEAVTPEPAQATTQSVEQPVANNNEEIVAVITAAICAMGYSSDRIASIRPSVSKGWKFDGRLSGRM